MSGAHELTARDSIEFASVDGRHVAYQVVGEGPHDVLLIHEWTTPLLDRWEQPRIAGALRRLTERCRVISFDRRGIGLSDPADIDEVSIVEEWGRDAVAVLDAAGASSVSAVGMSDGGGACLWIGATVPERVERVVLAYASARMLADDHYPGASPDLVDLVLGGVEDDWRTANSFPLFFPSIADDTAARRWFHRARLRQASPATALALLSAAMQQDLRTMVPALTQPVLVLQPESPTTLGPHAPEHGRYIADHVRNGVFQGLPGTDDVWWAENADRVADAILRFIADVPARAEHDRVLTTVAFTDIVSSTEHLRGSGDNRWRSLLDGHDAVVRERVAGYGGTVVKNTGDGFLLRFDGPARAVHCLLDVADEMANLGLEVRSGVHTGECEVRGADLAGIAVHTAARVMSHAAPNEVCTTTTVRDLVAGSSLTFTPRGTVELKGLGERELLAASR